jgi:preprotein translocase subunit SecB
MKKSVLQLRKYFFPVIFVAANPNCKFKKNKMDKLFQSIFYSIENIIVKKSISRNKEQSNLFQINLEIESGEDRDIPYLFSLQCIGEFEIDTQEVPAEKIGPLISVNGASVLYSACRELLIDQTAKSAYGSLTLPTVAFDTVSPEIHWPEGLKSISSSFKEEPEKKERKKSKNKATKPSSSKKKGDK